MDRRGDFLFAISFRSAWGPIVYLLARIQSDFGGDFGGSTMDGVENYTRATSKRSSSSWHFFVLCKKCNERIEVGAAPPPDEVPVVNSLRVTCRHCGNEYTYRGTEVGRVRKGRK
jgi:hypothetical protein